MKWVRKIRPLAQRLGFVSDAAKNTRRIVAAAFDGEHYRGQNPGVDGPDADLVDHFCKVGWKEGYDPSPDFSVRAYLAANPDVAEAGVNPFAHYLTLGQPEGRALSPEAAPAEVSEVENIEVIREAFDPGYYLETYKDVANSGMDPLDHFWFVGWKEGRQPNATFSTKAYLAANPDVTEAGVNPFAHYIVAGRAEKRPQRPQGTWGGWPSGEAVAGMAAIRDAFDPDYYLSTYPDIAEADVDPLEHFWFVGWKEGRDPNADFSIEGYLTANPDVAKAEVNAFWHYVVAGRAEGRTQKLSSTPAIMEIVRSEFDSDFYLEQNPDVLEADLDPLEHFCSTGWKEGRDPNEDFSISTYLSSNPDVSESVNPFWHFLEYGRSEGRHISLSGRVSLLQKVVSLEEKVEAWRANRELPADLLTADEILGPLRRAIDTESKRLVLSLGHDDYLTSSGGVQNCITWEERSARDNGIAYLNMSPCIPLPRLAHPAEDPDLPIVLNLDGKRIGVANMNTLRDAIGALGEGECDIDVVVHHLLGHEISQVSDLIRSCGTDQVFLWLHDFFSLCPSYALQRNDVVFCGAPKLGSNACSVCLYGAERHAHLQKFDAFFKEFAVHVIAPSKFAMEFWTSRCKYPHASLSVRAHLDLKFLRRKKADPALEPSKDTVIAFVGYPGYHKGWPDFRRIYRRFGKPEGSGYRFVYLGSTPIALKGLDRRSIEVTQEDPDAMTRALEEEKVDLLLHWASCAETFSFSTYEALSAGAYVVTNPNSGNVAMTVRDTARGVVLEDTEDLDRFLQDGRAHDLAQKARAARQKERSVLTRNRAMSFSVIKQEEQA